MQPWDKALIVEIEKAIQKSELGLNPSNDGKVIRISDPAAHRGPPQGAWSRARRRRPSSRRVALRNIRRDGIEDMKKLKDSGMPEDAVKKAEDELQKLTDSYVNQINKVLEEKEKEILEV